MSRLERECGIWGEIGFNRQWRLDFTEGHSRMRKKLQPDGSKKETKRALGQGDLLSSGLRISRQDSMSVWPKEGE